jgi:superfamily II DNA or RNA helicase
MNPSTTSIPSAPALELRLYQQRITTRAVDLFLGTARDRNGAVEPEAGSILIESPTGSGKTVMGLTIAKAMQARGMSVGWVAMRRNLLVQARDENYRHGFDVDLTLISMFDKKPPACDLMIVDEAQHDGALSMANVYSHLRPQKILGLSATPFRSDRFKLCFEKVIRDAGIGQLIQDGYLSPYHHYTIPVYSPESVAAVYLADANRWGQSLAFFHQHADCVRCCDLLTAGGIRAEVVSANTDRQRQIKEFAAGQLQVLVNMQILTEGFDCPNLRTVFCRPSGKLCTIQMAGRAFRKHPEIAFKQIVQCKNTRHAFPRTAAPSEQYLQEGGQWRALKINRQIEQMCAVMQKVIAAAEVSLPPFLAMHSASAQGRIRGMGLANRRRRRVAL